LEVENKVIAVKCLYININSEDVIITNTGINNLEIKIAANV